MKERFEEKVMRTKTCWLWVASLDKNGYGWFRLDGKMCKAHRIAYEMHNGPIPEGLSVMHKCDTPNCVNPAHLAAGTHSENMRDMAIKGRAIAPTTKLTDEQVVMLRADTRTLKEIGAHYGIHPKYAGLIKRGGARK